MEKQKPRSSAPPSDALQLLLFGVICVLGLIGFCVVFYFLWFNGPLSQNQSTWGAFGDYVGGVASPSIALLALVALVVAIKYQRDELQAVRQQVADSNRLLEAQLDEIASQHFRAGFFHLIENLHHSINAMELNATVLGPAGMESHKLLGRGVYSKALDDIFRGIDRHLPRGVSANEKQVLELEQCELVLRDAVDAWDILHHRVIESLWLRTETVAQYLQSDPASEPIHWKMLGNELHGRIGGCLACYAVHRHGPQSAVLRALLHTREPENPFFDIVISRAVGDLYSKAKQFHAVRFDNAETNTN